MLRFILALMTLGVSLAIPVAAQQEISSVDPSTLIKEVRLAGNQQISATTINDIIKTRQGRPFSESKIEEDKRALMNKGWFFDVKPQVEKMPDGFVVTFNFTERQILHYVRFIGNNKVARSKLLEECGIDKGSPLDPIAVHQAREKLETFYKLEGHYNIHVDVLRGDRIGDPGAVFLINEGDKQRILDVTFEGNQIASDSRLRTKIESRPGIFWVFLRGQFTRELVEADVEKLTNYYRSLGFFYAKVDYDYEETQGYTGLGKPHCWIKLKFLIDEGPRGKIRDIRFIGNKIYDEKALLKEMKSKVGGYYYQDTIEGDMLKLKDKHGVIGHVFAEATPVPRVDGDQVDLIVQIKEGPKCRYGNINIDLAGLEGGEPYTKLSTFLNYFTMKPGQYMSTKEIRDCERRLRGSQIVNGNPSTGAVPTFLFDYPEQAIADEERQRQEEEERQYATAGHSNFRGQQTASRQNVWRVATAPYASVPVDEEQEIARRTELYGIRPLPIQMPRVLTAPTMPAAPQQHVPSPPSYSSPVPAVPPIENRQPSGINREPVWRGQQSYAQTPNIVPYNSYNNPTQYPQQPGTAPISPTQPTSQPGDYAAQYYTGSGSVSPAPLSQPNGIANPSSSYPYATSSQPAPQPGASSPGYAVAAVTQPPIPQPAVAQTPNYGTSTTTSYGSVAPPVTPLQRSNRPANFGIMPAEDPAAPPKPMVYTVDGTWKLQETRTGQLMMSVMVNSDSGLMGRFLVEEQNFDICRWPKSFFRAEDWRNAFRGRGQLFRLEAMPGEQMQRYQVTWGTPYLFNQDYSLNLSGYYYQRFYDEWYEDRIGGTVTLGKNWTKDFSTALTFNGARVNIYHPITPTPYDLDQSLGRNEQFAFGLKAIYDVRDHPYMPTEGHLLSANIEQVVGSDQYLRGGYDARKYFMLHERPDRSGRWVLGLRSTANVSEGNTPIYERYYAGGHTNLRGFEYRSVTPRDPMAAYIGVGGCFEMYNSVELLFPLTADDMVRGLLFVDSGTVQKGIDKWDEEYRVSAGFGFRITIPMMGPAPIALDFAFPICKGKYDREQFFMFNIGVMR